MSVYRLKSTIKGGHSRKSTQDSGEETENKGYGAMLKIKGVYHPTFMQTSVAARIKGMYHWFTGINGLCLHNLVWKDDHWDRFTLIKDVLRYYIIIERKFNS